MGELVAAAALLVAGLLAWLLRFRALGAVFSWHLRRGRHPAALAVATTLRALPGHVASLVGEMLLCRVDCDSGRTKDATDRVGRVLDAFACDRPCPWAFLATFVDVLVNAGRYGEALALPWRWTREARRAGRRNDPHSQVFTTINRAEACHNLGRDAAALRMLDRAASDARAVPLAHSGLMCLRAWILATRGRPARARAILASVEPAAMGPLYAAEVHYTRAAVLRASGNLSLARKEARRGIRCAVRASSERNGLLLLASIGARAGDARGAARWLRAAMDHRYRGQGGPALLEVGVFLEEAGRRRLARRAYRAAVERDPESPAARAAAERLRRARRSRTEPARSRG